MRASAALLVVALLIPTTAVQAQRAAVPPVPPDVAAIPADAVKSATGLASKVVTPGASDEKALATDIVTVHYTGWTTDGKMFDSTFTRGQSAMFPLNRVILGWRECVQLMTVGETRRCWVPQDLGYRGQAGRPQGLTVFDIELIDTRRSPTVPPPDVAAPPDDARRTASGISYKVLKPGIGGRRPVAWSRVTVHYTGWTTDGKMFDSSYARNAPSTFPLDRVIKGWGEGLQLMTPGEKRRFWIPQTLAYNGQPGRPAGMLVFDVELLEMNPSPRVAPPDVAAPPADARKTPSGLAYKSLRAGKGGQQPEKANTVTVHYTGWTTDGKMFDSSVERGQPASFGLGDVIEGWTEGVQLMTVGENMRFWIPERLAYKGERPPRGMLVFDVELLAIK
jgi:FKBP-type peptidyl-prolyl cis-trans isomerase